TKARELVVRRALQYLDSLSSESIHDPSLERELAAAYERVGDVQGQPQFSNLGDTAGALRSHKSALALREALAAAHPSDEVLQTELRSTYDHLVDILRATGDLQGARDVQKKLLEGTLAARARNPTGVAERQAVGSAYTNEADLLYALGDLKGMFEHLKQALSVFEDILATDPGSPKAPRNAAIAHRRFGAILEKNLDRTAALDHYRRAAALDDARVRANANDRLACLDLSFDYASIGYALSTAGDIAGSLENYQQALQLRERVVAAD